MKIVSFKPFTRLPLKKMTFLPNPFKRRFLMHLLVHKIQMIRNKQIMDIMIYVLLQWEFEKAKGENMWKLVFKDTEVVRSAKRK